jgi:hypothetical protein
MNEQTKELAMKYANKMGNSVLHNAEHLEKFAELIVRECIGVVNKTDPPGYEDYPDYRDQIEKSFRIECVTEIKKHFGVEE